MMRALILVVALTTTGVLGWAAPTQAAMITYTAVSITTGTLGGTPFTDALVTVTLTADTSGVTEPDPVSLPGVLVNTGTATVSIGGGGSATFSAPGGYQAVFFPEMFLGIPILAIWQGFTGTTGVAISGLGHSSLAGYDVRSAFGPVTGPGVGLVTEGGMPYAFSTTAGALIFTGGNDPTTLTVIVAAVPEPASLSLLAVGALGVLAARRRRHRHDA